jgi:hypothetical protein
MISKREVERLLRAGGLSRAEAKAVLAKGYAGLPDADDEPDAHDVWSDIQRLADRLRVHLDQQPETRTEETDHE